MESRARIKLVTPTIGGGADVVIHVEDAELDDLIDKELRISLTQFRARRSRDANAYFHVLADKLADARRMSKPKMKNYLLFHYGQKCRDKDGNLVCIKTNADEEELISRSDLHCWYMKNAADGTPMYVLLEHSRFFDSRQMAILIDGVVEECKQQGIDTLTYTEIEEIKQKWGVNLEQHHTNG